MSINNVIGYGLFLQKRPQLINAYDENELVFVDSNGKISLTLPSDNPILPHPRMGVISPNIYGVPFYSIDQLLLEGMPATPKANSCYIVQPIVAYVLFAHEWPFGSFGFPIFPEESGAFRGLCVPMRAADFALAVL